MKSYSLINLFFLLALTVQAQQPQLVQERNYNVKPNDSQILSSAPDKQGNVLYSGTSWVNSNRYAHTFLMLKPNTDTIWARKSPTMLVGEWQAFTPLPNGGFIFGSHIPSNNTVTISLQKLGTNGMPNWTKNYMSVESSISAILQLPNKDFLFSGGYGQGKRFSFVRTDSLGNIKNTRDYTLSFRDAIVDMKFAANGNIIAAGMTAGSLSNTWHTRLLLLNQNGDSLKGAHLAIRGANRREGIYSNFSSVTPLSDGGFLLTANTDTVNATYPFGSYMGMVVKVDANLNVKWHYVHRTPDVDEYVFTKAKELTDGTILVLGFKFRPSQGGNGFQLYRFRPNGTIKDIYPFTSSICSQVWGITFDALADSTFMIGGRCGNNPPISFGFYVAKVKIPGLPPVLPPFTITGTKEETVLTGTGLGQSYPNPTAAEAIIPYSLPKDFRKASIIVREIATGRKIRDYDLKRGTSSLTVDVSCLSSGLYQYSLTVDDQPIATKKLAVVK